MWGNINKQITFTNVMDVPEEYYPKNAARFLPEWYKKTDSYMGGEKLIKNNSTNGTIKKCIPVFDALTSGYIIPTYADIYVTKDQNGRILFSTSFGPQIEHHPIIQAPHHPLMNQHDYPKILNPWSIKTPPGYSSLFLPPVHGGNPYFSTFEGLVDTDKFQVPVNFPFILKDINFEGIIPAGTPIVQIFLIKRNHWKIKFKDGKKANNKTNIDKQNISIYSLYFDRYKTKFWEKKNYV
jgi:hypothetical protein